MSLISLSPYSAALSLGALVDESSHLALFTANPIAAGNLSSEQADANGYARQAISWSSSGDEDEENTSDIEFQSSGAAWTGPWYLVAMDSSTHGSGNVIGIVVDPDTGDPVTTYDISGISGIADNAKLIIDTGDLKFKVGQLGSDEPDPVQEILDLNPAVFFLFDRISYKGTDLLFANEAGTTPITSDGDVIMCAKSLVGNWEATCGTANRGPKYVAGYGMDFESSGNRFLDVDLTSAASAGDWTLASIWRVSESDRRFLGTATGLSIILGTDASGNVICYNATFSPGDVSTLAHRKLQLLASLPGTAYFPEVTGWATTTGIGFGDSSFGRTSPSSGSRYNDTSGTCFVIWDRKLDARERATVTLALDQLGNDNYPYA